MKLIFPYIQKSSNFYPAIDVTLSGPKNTLTIKALIDSGASFSVFRPEIAEHIGVAIERGRQLYLEGVGGRILGYVHKIPIKVGPRKFRCNVVFSREFTVSFNLLGRNNFFSQFFITFDEKNHRVILV